MRTFFFSVLFLIIIKSIFNGEVLQIEFGESYSFNTIEHTKIFQMHVNEMSKNYIYIGVIPDNPKNKIAIRSYLYFPPIKSPMIKSGYDTGDRFLLIPTTFIKDAKIVFFDVLCVDNCAFSLYTIAYDSLSLNVNNSPESKMISNEKNIEFSENMKELKAEYIFLKQTKNNHFVIDIAYEDKAKFELSYYFNNNDTAPTTTIIYFSKKIVLSANEISSMCDLSGICKLTLILRVLMFPDERTEEVKVTLSAKSNAILPIFIKENYQRSDIIINNNIQYYYTSLNQGDTGAVTLFDKKGSGYLLGRIVNKKSKDDQPNWRERIRLPTKTDYDFMDQIVYDINTKEMKFTVEDTNKCVHDNPCTLIIAVVSNDVIDNEGKGDIDSIYEYTIYLRNDKMNENQKGITFLSHEYVSSTIYDTKEYRKFIYPVPLGVSLLNYEIQCESCKLFYSVSLSSLVDVELNPLPSGNQVLTKTGKFEIDNLLKVTAIILSVSTEELEDVTFTSFLLRVSPFYTNAKNNYYHVLSETMAVYDSSESSLVSYFIPVYKYDLLSEIIISVSTQNEEPVPDVGLNVMVIPDNDTDFLIDKEETQKKPKMTMIQKIRGSTSNYMSVASQYFEGTDSVCVVSINVKAKGIFHIFFTYEKKSHFNLLPPNRKNLLYVRQTKTMTLPTIIQNKNSNLPLPSYQKKSTMVKIKHLKGNGYVSLLKENSFPFDQQHNSFTVIYPSTSSNNAQIDISSRDGIYFYTNFNMKPNENMGEIYLYKTNYVMYSTDAFPLMLYIKLKEEDYKNRDIVLNFSILNLNSSPSSNWSLKGFLLNDNYIERRRQDNSLRPEFHKIFNGHFDQIRLQGTVTFSGNEINNYNTQYNKIILIRFHDKANVTSSINPSNVIVKVTAYPTKAIDYPLPHGEFYYSQIQYSMKGKEYNVYHLIKKEYDYNYFIIEFATCYGSSNFALRTDSFVSENKKYLNDTQIEILYDIGDYFGKRFLGVKTPQHVSSLYLFVFPDEDNFSFPDLDPIYFTVKYYSVNKKEEIDNYVAKTSLLKETKFEFDVTKSFFSWNRITSIYDYNEEYYLRIYSRNKFKKENEINSICLYNHALTSIKVDSDHIEIKNIPKGDVYANLIVVLKNKTNIGSESIIAYPAIKFNVNNTNIGISIGWIILGLLCVIVILLLLILYLYKLIRKAEMKHAYQLIDERRKNKGRKMIEKENDLTKTIPKNISCIIESDN